MLCTSLCCAFFAAEVNDMCWKFNLHHLLPELCDTIVKESIFLCVLGINTCVKTIVVQEKSPLSRNLFFLILVEMDGSWQLGANEIGKFASHGNAVFEVFSSASHWGYVAIDDVKIDNSKMCPVDGKFLFLELLIE